MDIYCPRCAEPCDLDELHYVDGYSFDEARRRFFALGCGLTFGYEPCEHSDSPVADLSAAIAELSGDDIDGYAADMEDAMFLGFGS